MTRKRKAPSRRPASPKTASKPGKPYVMPRTVAELGLDCAICHAPAVWFDFGRARQDHRAGLVCDDHPSVGHREKLLVNDQPGAQTV
jgi:hypothetical protein